MINNDKAQPPDPPPLVSTSPASTGPLASSRGKRGGQIKTHPGWGSGQIGVKIYDTHITLTNLRTRAAIAVAVPAEVRTAIAVSCHRVQNKSCFNGPESRLPRSYRIISYRSGWYPYTGSARRPNRPCSVQGRYGRRICFISPTGDRAPSTRTASRYRRPTNIKGAGEWTSYGLDVFFHTKLDASAQILSRCRRYSDRDRWQHRLFFENFPTNAQADLVSTKILRP